MTLLAIGPSNALRFFRLLRDNGFTSDMPLRTAVASVTQGGGGPSMSLYSNPYLASSIGNCSQLDIFDQLKLLCDLLRQAKGDMEEGWDPSVGNAIVAWLVLRLGDTPFSELSRTFWSEKQQEGRDDAQKTSDSGGGEGGVIHQLISLIADMAAGRVECGSLNAVIEQVC